MTKKNYAFISSGGAPLLSHLKKNTVYYKLDLKSIKARVHRSINHLQFMISLNSKIILKLNIRCNKVFHLRLPDIFRPHPRRRKFAGFGSHYPGHEVQGNSLGSTPPYVKRYWDRSRNGVSLLRVGRTHSQPCLGVKLLSRAFVSERHCHRGNNCFS